MRPAMFAPVFHTKAEIQTIIGGFRAKGERVALVPTMGALHEGHVALVHLARRHADRVVVSIFVNPTQFAPHEDFDRYPRTLGADVQGLGSAKVDLVYAPSVEEMYPEGFATRVLPDGGPAAGLESDARPHFFGGVATVVTKLFTQVKPDIAVFGEKDWQQLQVVKRMTRDLDLGVEIVPAPTIREADGLALSSRNRYLSPDDRKAAPALHHVLSESAVLISRGAPVGNVMTTARREIEKAGFTVDYMEARHAESLAPVTDNHHGPIRLLVAARIGGTRLIDNVAVPHGED
jgi:pantoate--beta-alanine ligase